MLWVVFSLFIIIIIIILVIIVIIIIVIITIIIINIIIIIVIIVIIIIILRRICYKFQAVVTASSEKSSRPKSCRPEPESCCPKFPVMSPEILSHVARNPKTCRPKFYRVFNLEEK